MNNAIEIFNKYGKVNVTVYPNRDYSIPSSFIANTLSEIHPLMESVNDDIHFSEPTQNSQPCHTTQE